MREKLINIIARCSCECTRRDWIIEMGEETDGLASSTSKLREEIKSLTGVDIMLDEDTFKSLIKT